MALGSTGTGTSAAAGKKAKKRKSKSLKKKLIATGEPAPDSSPLAPKRDFPADLKEYLELWKSRESGSGWKFNKVLQSWAVLHALDRSAVDKDLFKMMCPYLATMMGVQRDRFLETIEEVIDRGEAASEQKGDEGEEAASRPCYKRAIKLRTVMSE